MSLQACLDQAAEALGIEADDWVEGDGPDSGVGVDRWFAHGTRTLNINQDQSHWSWEVTCTDDEEFYHSGAVNEEG